jgi:hypothetical protein
LESAEHFDEPLVEQCRGQKNQNARGSASEVETVENETRLDGFAQAHFVSKKHARSQAGRHLGGDRDLVGNQIDPAACESASWILTEIASALETFHTNFESLDFIHLPSQQAFFGF